jgi:hypothetical protein
MISLMPTSLDNRRFSFHCPSSTAACFRSSHIYAARGGSNYHDIAGMRHHLIQPGVVVFGAVEDVFGSQLGQEF